MARSVPFHHVWGPSVMTHIHLFFPYGRALPKLPYLRVLVSPFVLMNLGRSSLKRPPSKRTLDWGERCSLLLPQTGTSPTSPVLWQETQFNRVVTNFVISEHYKTCLFATQGMFSLAGFHVSPDHHQLYFELYRITRGRLTTTTTGSWISPALRADVPNTCNDTF